MKIVAAASLAIFLAVTCTACQAGTSRLSTLRSTVAGLNLENAEADARSNFARGDNRFIGVVDVGCHAPGREGIALEKLVRTYGLRCLDGTSDVIENSHHRALQETVAKYGVAYNKCLAALIGARSN